MTNSAIQWLRDHATVTHDEIECDGVMYDVTRLYFCGNMPRRMIAEMRKHVCETGDFVHETWHHGGTRSTDTRIEYFYATYTKKG